VDNVLQRYDGAPYATWSHELLEDLATHTKREQDFKSDHPDFDAVALSSGAADRLPCRCADCQVAK
jgi:hypothetical protein